MGAVLFTLISGLLINECSDLSPWLAHKLVRWSAHLRYADPAEADDLATELAAWVTDRPGKLLKLLLALGFLASGIYRRLHRRLSRDTASFMDEPMTWAGQFHGFIAMVSLVSVFLFRSAPAVAGFAFVFVIQGQISSRIKKMRDDGRVSRFQSPYAFFLVFVELPAAYLAVLTMAIFSVVQIIEGHSPVGMVIALVVNLFMLTAPLTWIRLARVWARIERTEAAPPPA